MRKKHEKGKGSLYALYRRACADRRAFFVFVFLFLLVLLVLLHSLLIRRLDRVFTGGLTLCLLLIPPVVEHRFSLRLPTALEILAYVFVFCAGVLGEIGDYYQRYPFFDTVLHAANGYMFAAFGFCLVDLFERHKKENSAPSAAFLSFVAFCFSMTVGTLWELFEYMADRLLGTDMQKDTLIHTIRTVKLSGAEVEKISDIVSSYIISADGTSIEIQGYLDIGLIDTVKDLGVNLLGALLFCLIGYFYFRTRKGKLAKHFIPTVE